MQIICTTLQTDNHASTPSLYFLRAGCSCWCPTHSVKALKADAHKNTEKIYLINHKKGISWKYNYTPSQQLLDVTTNNI